MMDTLMTLIPLSAEEVHTRQARLIKARVRRKLQESLAGHCLRISTLPIEAGRALCAELNGEGLSADVVLLLGARREANQPWEVSATRLVELRNAARRPLLAFIPPGEKAAAEDSINVSTFAELELGDIPAELRRVLSAELPEETQRLTDQLLRDLRSQKHRPDDDEVVRYYLTILKNDSTPEAIGGAIYHLGLIPHFSLALRPAEMGHWIDRNLAAIQKLQDSSDTLLTRIHNLKLERGPFQAELFRFLRNQPVQQVKTWGGSIATDPTWRALAFDCWPLALDSNPGQALVIDVDDLEGLGRRYPSRPANADNPPVLDIRKAGSVKIKWQTDPKAAVVDELHSFRVQIVRTEDGEVCYDSRPIKKSTSGRADQNKALKVSDFRDLVEDGLYFFRVRAYTEGGEILNVESAEERDGRALRDRTNPQSKRTNETEDVWFWKPNDPNDSDPPVEPQRNTPVNSFMEAQLLTRLAALDNGSDPLSPTLAPQPEKTGWATEKGKRTEAVFQIVYDSQTRYTLPVSGLLRQIESDTLANPDSLGRYRLSFVLERSRTAPQPVPRQYRSHSRPPESFMAARQALFAAIRGTQDLLIETIDLLPLAGLIQNYIAAYENWLASTQENFNNAYFTDEGGRQRTDALFLDIDTVEVILPNDTQYEDRVYLLAATHPLRVLWHLQRARLAQAWVEQAAHSDKPKEALPASLRRYLRQRLAPVNLPPTLRPAHETSPEGITHFYVEGTPLNAFWGCYQREDVRDRRELDARLRKALNISRKDPGVAAIGSIDKNLLITKFQRYLAQHPYTHSLKINIFNPGDAGLFVDAILGIEKLRRDQNLPDLRYEVHLFTEGTLVDEIGAALEDLINPERQVSPEADPFSIPSRNPLFPKLRFFRHQQHDFLDGPEVFDAHLTILYDVFPIQAALSQSSDGRSSYLHGLIQDQVTIFEGSGSGLSGASATTNYAWRRQLHPAKCRELPDGNHGVPPIAGQMASLLQRFGNLQACVAAGKSVPDGQPALHLNLAIENKNLLNLVHQVSDWVVIIDRNLGLEYFDSAPAEGRSIYLLDFVPEFSDMDTERLLLTTRLTDEIIALVHPALEERQLDIGENAEAYVLSLLRSLSGRLALKLISAPNSASEALGLAMARLFLESFNLLQDRILIPLDAHTGLFQEAARDLLVEDEASFKRSDLLLVGADPQTRSLNFHVIEVKWRADLRELNAYIGLKTDIEDQLLRTVASLRQHFDPHLNSQDRIDRAAKTRELIALLSFYLARSNRYGLVDKHSAKVLQTFIESLDDGYSVTFNSLGLIFDQSSSGMSSEPEHAGLMYYHVGMDYIRRMLELGLRGYAELTKRAAPVSITEAQEEEQRRRQIVEATRMTRDVVYERVQTDFRSSSGVRRAPRSDVLSESAEAPLARVEVGSVEHNGHEENTLPTALQTPAKDEVFPETHRDEPQGQVAHPQQPKELPENQSFDVAPEPIDTDTTPLPDDEQAAPAVDVLVGDSAPSRQYGVLGKSSGKTLALDLNGVNTISLFGVQGGGKSYTVGSIVEMATQPFPGVNWLPKPLATVIFHYHESQDYPPEFVSMVEPNSKEGEARTLIEEYGAHPGRLEDVLILTSGDKLDDRRQEFPSIRVEPIAFSSSELSMKDWLFLMGALGGNQMYMKQINMIMRQRRNDLTLDTLREEVNASELSDQQKNIAKLRLDFAGQFIEDSRRLSDQLRPGRLIIVDLRDELILKDEALGLFVVMLNIFASAGREEGFNKLIVFDEAHKYMDDPDLTRYIVEAIRQMRHQGVSLLIASQDPPSLPNAIIELSSLVILHRFNSPQWLRHIQKSITALSDLTAAQLGSLGPGEAFLWATKATERIYTQKAVRVRFRPRLTQHGGGTKTAV